MKKAMLVFGTRPEAIKMCPVAHELKKRNIKTIVCVTGQHREMLNQVLELFDLVPDYNLDIMKDNQDLFDISVNILGRMKDVLSKVNPDIVLVHGDTSTGFIASLACFYYKIPVAHVEAGLRTHDLYSPFPEEFNRQAIDLIANYYFAPTIMARDNLILEGKNIDNIFVTGNTIIDTLNMTVKKDYGFPDINWSDERRIIYLTLHRRESIGEPIRNILKAIRRILDTREDIEIVFPLHPNPRIREIAHNELDTCDRVHMIEPVDVVASHNIESICYLCLTDSGGVQEECAALGKPTLVLRNNSERMEMVDEGIARLVGHNEEFIFDTVMELLDNSQSYDKMAHSSQSYGDGKASIRIVDIVETILA